MNSLIAVLICVAGAISQYDPGVMERVIANRQAGRTARPLPRELPQVDGYIAVLRCDEIGQLRRLKIEGKSYTVLIADCAGSRGARRWMLTKNVIAEVDYKLAQAGGFVGRGVKGEVCEQ